VWQNCCSETDCRHCRGWIRGAGRSLECWCARCSEAAHRHCAVVFAVATAARWQVRLGVGWRGQQLRGERQSECNQQHESKHSAEHPLSIANESEFI
jgi:hypothetical protein